MPTITQHHPTELEHSILAGGAENPPRNDRRASARMASGLIATVESRECGEIYDGPADDISEGGLYVRVPLSRSLGVGERCEVRLSDPSGATPACLAGETCYATVVRTEVVTSGSETFLGAGLRFDRPLFL
jgi:hypothetical protein